MKTKQGMPNSTINDKSEVRTLQGDHCLKAVGAREEVNSLGLWIFVHQRQWAEGPNRCPGCPASSITALWRLDVAQTLRVAL